MTRRVVTSDGAKFTLFFTRESPFSNFFPCTFTVNDEAAGKQLTFHSSEQYFMYQKAVAFKDMDAARQIVEEIQPNRVRALGRKVRNFDDQKWNNLCFDAMKRAVMQKFSQNKHIRKQLLSTQDSILAECSPRDCTWGIGLSCNSEAATRIDRWRGENKLGKALMEVRDELWLMNEFKEDVNEVEEMLSDETRIKTFLEKSPNPGSSEKGRKRKWQS